MDVHVKQRIVALARGLGFDLVGVTTPDPLPEAERAMQAALRSGRLKALPWMSAERVRLAAQPQELFPAARSILSLGMSYLTDPPMAAAEGHSGSIDGPGIERGRVARYAWGEDYHRVVRRRMLDLLRSVETMLGRPIAAKACVDTAPLAERAIAQRAGLGWQGKNATLIVPGLGSWFVLGEILWDLELPPDMPSDGRCGTCDRCLRACPTGALAAPYEIEVGRCLAYLTIEHRGEVPEEFRSLIGDRLFGCDACQEACPHNAAIHPSDHPIFTAQYGPWLSLRPLLTLTDAEFASRFGHSSLRRAGAAGLVRNAQIVLDNLCVSP